MKSALVRLSMLGVFALAIAGSYTSEAAEPQPTRDLASFGVLRLPGFDAVKGQAQDWLKSTNKFDQGTFNALWSQTERPLLDLVADTFALGNPEAARLLADARDPDAPAPKEVPSILKDTKLSSFFRSNLALAYAKALSNKKVYEEGLEALKSVKAEQVVDPGAYFFHKAVAEHGMLQKSDATRTIARLLDDVPDAPERYRMVSILMVLDMQQWKDKDLGDISRKMNNVERRLELARGGPQTQKMQKEIVARLDELIKKLENQQKQGKGEGKGDGNGGQCPEGGAPGAGSPGSSPGSGTPSAPQTDSMGGSNSGPGNVDPRKIKEIVEGWGKLPEKERAKAMTEMIRSMPPAYRAMIEDFYKKSAGAVEGIGGR